MIFLQMERPRPVPWVLAVRGEWLKKRSAISGAMPGPVSSISVMISFSFVLKPQENLAAAGHHVHGVVNAG